MQVCVAKYWGIYEDDVAEFEGDGNWVYEDGPHSALLKLGRDAFHTNAEALAAAEAMRAKKIASLEKQIEKLRKLKFSE